MEIIKCAKMRIKLFKIICPITMVGIIFFTSFCANILRNIIHNWGNPNTCHTKLFEVIKLCSHPFKVSTFINTSLINCASVILIRALSSVSPACSITKSLISELE